MPGIAVPPFKQPATGGKTRKGDVFPERVITAVL